MTDNVFTKKPHQPIAVMYKFNLSQASNIDTNFYATINTPFCQRKLNRQAFATTQKRVDDLKRREKSVKK